MTDSLYALFLPPKDFFGDFGLFCGFTATPDTLAQIKRRFTSETSRPALAAFIHPTVNAVSDVPGLAWMWMDPARPGYNLLHAKVALLGFRRRGGDGYLIRLAVSTGNWTQDPLTGSIDMFWSIELDLLGRTDHQSAADIRAAWQMFDWLKDRADTSLIDRTYDGRRPDAMLSDAVASLPATDLPPRFIDSRIEPLADQVTARLSQGRKQNRLIIGSGFYEGESGAEESVPERLRRRLIETGKLDPDGSNYLTLNPASCQGMVSRATTLVSARWQLCAPWSPLHGRDAKLHAKFVAVTNWERGNDSATGRLYLGSGNLSRNGFETAAKDGGNLEAGVVFDMGKLQWRKNGNESILKRLPVDFDSQINIQSLQPGVPFERPEEPLTLPPATFLLWADGRLSAPEDKAISVLREGYTVTTPCDWPGHPPVTVVTASDGWRLPVIAEGALVVPRPQQMSVEDILAGLSSFPEPPEGEPDAEVGGDVTGGLPVETPPASQSVYPIRRMMHLLVQLAEAQARIDPRDWSRWCRELRQNLVAIAEFEEVTIGFFRNARANPLPVLLDERMRPAKVDVNELEIALATVATEWRVADLPSLWTGEAA